MILHVLRLTSNNKKLLFTKEFFAARQDYGCTDKATNLCSWLAREQDQR